MLSWGQFLAAAIIPVIFSVVAHMLWAYRVSLKKLYLVLVGVATPVTVMVVAMPKDLAVNPNYTWFCVFGYCFPTPWTLLFGFAIGNFAFLCLWGLIKYYDR